MANISTPLRPIWTEKSTADGMFIPLTGAISTANVKTARIGRWLESAPNCTVQVAYNMSDDGISWDASATGIGSYSATDGWVYNEGTVSSVTTDQKLFVRFGLLVKNVSGSDVQHGLAKLHIELDDYNGTTVGSERIKVYSQTTTEKFHPMTGSIAIEDIGEIRGTLQMECDSGDAEITAAYQVSNDRLSWDSGEATGDFTTFGSTLTAEGISYGTTFASFAPTYKKQWVRFGVACKNGSGGTGKNETCLASIRVDYRQS